jgi:hypothetical protein
MLPCEVISQKWHSTSQPWENLSFPDCQGLVPLLEPRNLLVVAHLQRNE